MLAASQNSCCALRVCVVFFETTYALFFERFDAADDLPFLLPPPPKNDASDFMPFVFNFASRLLAADRRAWQPQHTAHARHKGEDKEPMGH